MTRIFSTTDGFTPVDFTHCGLDHIAAAELLFDSSPNYFDSAGYLAHISVELLLKAWLLQVAGKFEGIHNLDMLYSQLEKKFGAPKLNDAQINILKVLDGYEQLRYPDPKRPTEVGEEEWPEIEALVGFICRTMPKEILVALEGIESGRKAGRVLMRKRIE